MTTEKGKQMVWLATHCDICKDSIKHGQKAKHMASLHPELEVTTDDTGHLVCLKCETNKLGKLVQMGSWAKAAEHFKLVHKVNLDGASPAESYPLDIGDRVLDSLLNKLDDLKARLENQNQLKEQIGKLVAENQKLREEADRVVKLHNEQIARKNIGRLDLHKLREARE